MSLHHEHRTRLQPLREAMVDFDAAHVRQALTSLFSRDALVQLAYPFETLDGPEDLFTQAYQPLQQSIPDLERRDTIVIAGSPDNGSHWVGCCGYYTGSFMKPWLDIPATGHHVSMRFHEFYRFQDNRVVEMQALWDIPELMLQANAWPMSPSLGREWHVPGPATQDGIKTSPQDDNEAQDSVDLVCAMLEGLGQYASGGVEAMQLEKHWHPYFSWYGPSGIGTCRGVQGFRNWHQIPFLNGMPNRVGDPHAGNLFGEGNYAGFTAWPGMHMTISADGFLGIPPVDKKITMRSLDFWRRDGNVLRENWVLVDLLHVYNQLGVDVFARLKEFNKARGAI